MDPLCVCVCVCVRERVSERGREGRVLGGACVGLRACVCVCVGVEVVFAGQAVIIRDSLRVGSESKIILALKN